MKKTQKKGFTIVELLIVIAVIAVLTAVMVPVMITLIDDAEMSADEQTVASLNKAIAAETDDIDTMSDAVEAASGKGYDVETIAAGLDSDGVLVWDSTTKYFALVGEDGSEIYANGSLGDSECLFRIAYNEEDIGTADADPEGGSVTLGKRTVTAKAETSAVFSYYLSSTYEYDTAETLSLPAGIDVGGHENVYVTVSSDAEGVLIANMNGGELVIESGNVSLYGSVTTVKIASGSLVVENQASVGYVVSTAESASDVSITLKSEVTGGVYADESSISGDSTVSVEVKSGQYSVTATDFDSLQAALSGDAVEVVLGADITVTGTTGRVYNGYDSSTGSYDDHTAILDMAGHSIVADSTFSGGRPVFNYGTLTIKGNGTIDSTEAGSSGYGAIRNYGTLTIENGTFTGAVLGYGSTIDNYEGRCVINGGYFEGCSAVYNRSDGEMVINGGTYFSEACNQLYDSVWGYVYSYCVRSAGSIAINGGTVLGVQGGIAVSGGSAVINDVVCAAEECGTWEATPMGTDLQCDHSGHSGCSHYALYIAGESDVSSAVVNGGTFTSAYRTAVLIGNDNTGGDGGINADAYAILNGGTFSAPDGVAAVTVGYYTGNPFIYGGTYSTETVAVQNASTTSYTLMDFSLSASYETVQNTDGTYTVQAK